MPASAKLRPLTVRQKMTSHEDIMKVYQSIILITFFFLTSIAKGQSIDVETELFSGTKKLIVKSFNGLYAEKGFKAIYYFDNNGRAVKSSNYYKKQLRASSDYYYNDKGLLIKIIKTFDINNKNKKDTTTFEYILDINGKVTSKTARFGKWIVTENFAEFDTSKNTQPIQDTYNNRSIVIKRKYNSIGNEILTQRSINDTIISTEESEYNEFGDKI
jgi:hypothetical protein